VLATGGSGTGENDRRKEKQKSEKRPDVAHHLRLGKGIRRRRNTLFEFGGLSFGHAYLQLKLRRKNDWPDFLQLPTLAAGLRALVPCLFLPRLGIGEIKLDRLS
jgi:hypothetical protein